MFCYSCLGRAFEGCWNVLSEFLKVLDDGPKRLSNRALNRAARAGALEPCACCLTDHSQFMSVVEVAA